MRVTLDDVLAAPAPKPAPWIAHPVPHGDLVLQFLADLQEHGMIIDEPVFELSPNGRELFVAVFSEDAMFSKGGLSGIGGIEYQPGFGLRYSHSGRFGLGVCGLLRVVLNRAVFMAGSMAGRWNAAAVDGIRLESGLLRQALPGAMRQISTSKG